MSKNAPEQLNIRNDWLLAFVDEVGHETFAGTQPYFGFGGCVVTGEHYEVLKAHWRNLRRLVNGDPDAPLHAAELQQTPDNLNAVSQIFLGRTFARIGAAATKQTSFRVDIHTVAAVGGMLKAQIVRVMARTPCSTLALIFEQSERGDPLLTHFGTLGLEEAGKPIPVEHCIMSKRAREPGLELADFVASAVGSQARRYLRGSGGFAQDFKAVFHQLPLPYGQFCLITNVEGNPQTVGQA